MEGGLPMVQSRACVQKVVRSHVRLVLPFGFKCHRGTRRTGPYQEDSVRPLADYH